MIWRLFREGTVPHVSTFAYHEHRDRAPHLDQAGHRPRLLAARDLVDEAARLLDTEVPTLSDLGCGDGGLLSLVQDSFEEAWGYDFCPANAAGWKERDVDAEFLDVFNGDRSLVQLGDVVVMTEVLEHVADPHGVVRWLYDDVRPAFLVCSSPWDESDRAADECHAWAYDRDGYRELFEGAGWQVLRHNDVGRYQLLLAGRRPTP